MADRKAFRIAKSDFKIRPIYHQLQHRIEAHICVSFVAYKIYKELERQLKLTNAGISPEKAVDIAKSIFQLEVEIEGEEKLKHILLLTKEQKNLASLFAFQENW